MGHALVRLYPKYWALQHSLAWYKYGEHTGIMLAGYNQANLLTSHKTTLSL